MFIKRSKPGRFVEIGNGYTFKFTERNDNAIYVMIENYEGTYRRRSGSQEVLTLSDREERWSTNVIEVIEMPTLSERGARGFDCIVNKGREIGWPEAFYDDLWIHDRRNIALNDPAVFGWFVRKCGTHMLIPNDVYSLFLTAAHMKKHEREQSESRHFFFNGDSLKEMPVDLIEERLVKASTPKCQEFAKRGWYDKNTTTISGAWQKEINAELEGKATLRAECIGRPYC